jgi:hypothetical protein
LADDDFATGSLRIASYARPGQLFTAHRRLMVTHIGQLKPSPCKILLTLLYTFFAAV